MFVSDSTDEVKNKIQRLNISILSTMKCSQFGGLYVGGDKPNTDGFLCALNPPMPLYQVDASLFIFVFAH